MISTLVKNALSDLDLPNYFITRLSDKNECIVYNYTATPSWSADNEEKATKNKKDIIIAMQKAGFMRKSVASTVANDTGFFCTAITFAIVLHN